MKRCILHYDMDAFYASIEQRDNPKLKGKAIAVGRGVITTASYEARKYGVRSAMPSVTAKKLCPELILLPVRIDYYKKLGKKIQDLIQSLTYKCEFISSDEGYVDITEYMKKYTPESFIEKFKNRWVDMLCKLFYKSPRILFHINSFNININTLYGLST